MFLGIEIGGTKLQLGVGTGEGPPLIELLRLDVQPQRGAEPIRTQIERAAGDLLRRHNIEAIGIGFGGPVDSRSGRVIVSNQVEGWRDFPIVDWTQNTFGRPTILANDSDSAGLAEARVGAGRGRSVVFYSNVGSGIGGALVIDGKLFTGGSGVAAEIGHLRPGVGEPPERDVEAIASGWAIARWVREKVNDARQDGDDLLQRCEGRLEKLDTRTVADAARSGNALARAALDRATDAFGWALAQMITLLSPDVVVVGGGVSLVGEDLFFEPLRQSTGRHVFPALADTYQIVPAQLGEEVVVHGAIVLARDLR